MTLVEIMVASAISLTLLGLMTTMVTVFGKAETSTVNSANAAASVRLTLLQLQHDIQSANPLGPPLATTAAYSDTLQLTAQPSNTVVTWQYSFTVVPNSSPTAWTGQLTRTTGSSTVVELTGVTNGDPTKPGGMPVFSYFDHCAINQVTEAQASPQSISSDSTVVQVTLSVANLNSAPYGTTTSVNIMDQPPGASRCG